MTSLRSRLFHGTAVAAALVLVPSASRAATIALPTGGTVQAGTVTATGTGMVAVQAGGTFVPGATPVTPQIGAVTPGMGDTLTLTVGSGNHNSAVINWSGGFDIGSSNTVTFVGPSTTTPFTVLNRVTSGSITTIAGILQGDMNATAGNRGTVFVSNESGITFANSATVTNLTGLVASSLDITVSDFNLFAAGTQPLHVAGTGSNAVSVDPDAGLTHAAIAPDSVLLLVAPKLSVNGGALSATDTGFVLANDAKVALNATSIISIEIDAGTAIGGSVLNGTVAGQRVLVAAATSTDLMASLLGVGGNLTATTVSATDHGIVIAAGQNAAIDGVGDSITFTAPATPAIVGVSGILGSSGRVDAVATGALTVGNVNALGSASFTSGTVLTLGGNVSAVGDVTASGTGIVLGADGASHHLIATGSGAITLTASLGGAAAIATLGDYSIKGSGAVVLQQAAGTPANVTQDDSLAITGSRVSVGNIALAATLPTAFGGGDVVLTANGATTGDSVVAGTVAAQSAVKASSTSGAVTLGGVTSGSGVAAIPAPHDVTVTAAGVATVSGAVTSTGNYNVVGSGVSLGGTSIVQQAVGDVLVKSTGTNIAVAGALSAASAGAAGHVLVLDTAASITGGGNLSAGTASDVLLAFAQPTAGDVTLGSITARQFASTASLATPVAALYSAGVLAADTLTVPGTTTLGVVTTAAPNTIASTTGLSLASDTSSTGAVTLSSSAGNVTAGSLSSNGTGDVTVTATSGIATISGVVSAARDYAVTGDSVVLGTAGAVTQSAQRNVNIMSTVGAITAAGSLNLISNSSSGSGAGAGNLTLTAATDIGDSANPALINVYGGPIAGTAVSRRAITLDVTASPTGSISLGTVRGASLTGPGVPLQAGGPVALGDVDVLSDLNVKSLAALSLTSGKATGNVALGGTTIAVGAAGVAKSLTTATAAKTITLTASAGGAAAVTALGDFTISAPGAVVLQQLTGTPANVTHDDSLAIIGSSVSVGDIALAATPPALVGTGNVVLTANGAATTDSVTADIVTARNAVSASSAHGDVTLGGATSGIEGIGAHDVTVTAAVHAVVGGAVTSAGDYTVVGHDVTLGSAASGVTQQAVGNLYVRSSSIMHASGTLVADSGGVGGKRLVLDASAIADSGFGPVNLRAGSTTARTSDILLSIGSGSNLALGTVDANSFGTATPGPTPVSVGNYTPDGTLTLAGAISLGAVTTVQSNTIVSTGTAVGQRNVTVGSDTSLAGGVEVGAAVGAVSIAGPVSAHTAAYLHADAGTLSTATVKAFSGDARLVGAAGITVTSGNAVAALGNVSLKSDGTVVVNDVLAGGTITVGGVSGSTAGSLTGGSLEANGGISIATTGSIDLTSGTTVSTQRRRLNPTTLAAFDGAPTAPDAAVTLTSGDAIHVTALASTGSITLNGVGAVTVSGTVAAGDDMTAPGDGNYTVIGGNVVVGGVGVAQTATGNVLVRSTATNIAAAGTLTAGGELVIDSMTSIDGIALAGPPASLAVAKLVATTDVLLRTGSGYSTTLGDIGAARLASATSAAMTPMAVGDYTPVLNGGVSTLQSDGAITLGAVTTTQSNAIIATGATQGHRNVTLAGDTSTTGSVEAGSSDGAVSITGPVSAHTSADLHADGAADPMDATAGTLSVATVDAFHGDATLVGGTGITVATGHPVAALDNVNLRSGGAIVVDAALAGGVITVAGLAPGTGAASLTTTGLTANGGVSVTTSGALDLSMLGLLTPRTVINADLSGFNPANAPYLGNASIVLTSTASSVKAASITATGSITLKAATAATVTGNVEAGFSGGSGDYTVTGAQVALGGAVTTQKATGNVWIRSTGGGLGLAGTFVADDAGVGGRRLVLDTAGAIAPIAGLSAANLVAGAATPSHRSDVLIRQGDDTQAITLGNITANQLATAATTATPPMSVADYAVPVANTLTTAGAITLGEVNTLQSSTIVSTGPGSAITIGAGGDTSGGAIVLTSNNGNVTANGPISAATRVNLSAAGALTIGDVTAQNGDATLVGGTIIASTGSHAIAASGMVNLQSPGAITLAADAVSGSAITVRGNAGPGSAAGSFAADSLHATGPIMVATTGNITLAGTNATSLVTSRATPLAADADATLTSSTGAVTIKNATTTGSLSLTAAGAATAMGVVTIGDATTLPASGNYSVTGGTIVLGAPGVVQSATGNINLASAGSIDVSTLLARGSIFAAGPGGATPLAGSFTGVSLETNGAISIVTSGAITLTGTGLANTATERAAFDPTLRTFTLVGAPSAADQNITLASSTGAVTAADLASTGNIALSAGGAVAVSGTVAAGDGMTLAGDGNYSALGTSIALGGGISGQAALGNISLETLGTVTLTALRAGGTITARGVPVGMTPTSAASLLGDSLQANGAITVATTGAITLQGIHATSIATERHRIDTGLGGFNGAATASDANVSLTAMGSTAPSVPGTINVNGGSSTGNIVLTAGTTSTPVAHGAIIATGTFTAGDSTTANGGGDFTASADDVADASAAALNARHSVSVTSQTNDALIATATAGLNSLVGGAITAQTFASGLVHGSTGAVASIQSGTTSLGDVKALATGAQGVATIVSGTATQGNILADGSAAATVTMATTLGASGDITAHSQSGSATVTSGSARGSVRALAGTAALVDTGIAANGNVDALGGTTATITSGMASSSTAALGNVQATSTGGGLATITSGSAAQSVVASGGSATVGSATAGDDIVLIASTGAATATTLTVTGAAATEAAATDAGGAALTFGGNPVTGLGGSNVILRAGGAASVTGAVSVMQANIAKSANYDVLAGSVTLGTAGVPLSQGAAGRVDIATTSGDVVFVGMSGQLTSNIGGNRVANTAASAAVAGGGLTIAALGDVTGATTDLLATARLLPSGYDVRVNQPGVTVTSTSGSVDLATITGGPVMVTAPVVLDVPVVTSWGDVLLAGSPGFGDTATVMPVQIVVNGLNAGAVNPALAYAAANVTVAGGAGAEVTSLTVTNGGLVNALQVLSNSGAATLRATPTDPTKIASILIESQTGVAAILNPAGGSASSANPNTVAAQNIVLRGRQAGSSVLATGLLLATGSILATGPSVTIGTAAVTGTAADGTGDILIAATNTASLAAGSTETAVARRTINVTGGAATLGDGTATGGTLAVSGSSVTVLRNATAGDDVVLTSTGAIAATNAAIRTTGTADLQSGDDTAGLSIVSVGTAAGTGYGTGHTVDTNILTPATDAVTGGSLTRLAGANIVATATGDIDFGAATLTATAGRDIHVEAGGTVDLATASAARQFVGASGGSFTTTGSIAAGDDLVIGSGAAIDVDAATLRTTGGAASAADARRADGTLLAIAAAGGTLTNLAGSNIALAAAGPIQLGAIATTTAPSSLRAFSGAAITTTQAIAVSGDIALVGATVADAYGLTAGDDIVAVARGGALTLSGPVTTTGTATSNAVLVDLAGNGIALPGEAALGRVDGSSILVAATGTATVSTTVASAGRYSVYGRGGIALGTTGAATSQSAAGDVLLEASIGAAPAPASVTLADGMVLTANSDGVEAARVGGFVADPLVIRVGNGSVAAAGATLRVLRTPNATLADQGTVEIQPIVADGVTSIAVATLDSASADLRALGDVTIGSANIDAGLTLASKAGAVALTTLTVGTSVPLMTAAQVNAVDVKLSGATGAVLRTVATGANLVRDITVATVGGDASIGTASARDDIVVASATGRAIAGDLTFAGTASDSEAGVATIAATDADGIALPDPYGLTGVTITGLAERNIVVSGATAASLNSVTTAASDSLGDVRVLTAAGPATLTSVNAGGAGLPGRVIVATRNGVATGTTLNASGDIIVDATVGNAVLTSGNAGRDGIVVAPTVLIGTLTAGDDIVAVATGGTLTAGILTSTGVNSGDGITTVFRADGTSIVDPVAGGVVGNLAGGNVVALATGDVTVTTATAIAAPGASAAGLVRIGSHDGAVVLTGGTATAGDLVLTGTTIAATTLSAGRDATITTTGSATLPQLTAGRDIAITAASATLGADTGLVAAQRNLVVTTSGALTIGTARAGEDLTATGASVLATTLAAGDALTVTATSGDATVTTASSTGLPLLADFSGFTASGTAPGVTRDVTIAATGAATLTTGTAVHGISVTGDQAAVVMATANTGGTDGDLVVSAMSGGASLGTGAARDVLVEATASDIVVGSVTASRDVVLTAPLGTATLTTALAGRDIRVSGGDIDVTTATANTAGVGGDLVIVAASSQNGTDGSRAGGVTLSSGTARDITITADGEVGVNVASASRDLTITSPAITLTTGTAGNNIALIAYQGCCNVGPVLYGTVNAGSATANAGGGTGSLGISGNTILGFGSGYDVVVSGDTLTLNQLVALHDIDVAGTISATLTTATAGHSITLTGKADASLTTATANTSGTDGDLLVSSFYNAYVGIGSARDIRVSGNTVTATSLNASRDLYLDSFDTSAPPASTVSVMTGSAGRNATIVGPAVSIGTLTAGSDVVAVATHGTLTAGVLTSTGADSSDGITTVIRSDGSAVLDPTVAGSPAVGALAGGNVVALASGDLTVGAATATAAAGATAPGLVRLASLGTTMVTTATSTAGDLVVAGGAVAGGTLTAGRDATVTAAAGDITLAAIGSGRDLVLTASNDVVAGGSATSGGEATLTAGRDINLGATATGDALDAGGNATLVSGRDIIVARPATIGLALSATAGGAASFAGTNSGGATTIGAQGDLTLTGDTDATGAVALTSAGGAITAPDISGNGITLAAANAITISGTTASTADLSATGGSLAFGTLTTAADAALHAMGSIAVAGATTTGGALTVTSDTGAIQQAAVTTGGVATITAANGSILLDSLGTTGAATLLAAQSATVSGLAQTTGALTATATDGGLSFGAIDSGAAATLRARTALSVAELAEAAGTLDALSSAGAVSLGSAQAATVTIRGATGVAVSGGTTSTGPVTLTADAGSVATGDIASGAATSVTATSGAVTLASVSRTAGLTVAAATDATVTGDINSSSDVGVTATGGSATIGSVSNAGKLMVTAANNATIGGSVQTSADTLITATSGSATVGGAVKTANYTIKANNGTIALGSTATATQASSGTATLDSQRLTLGAGVALVATKQIQLDVTGNAVGVSLGDGPGAAAGTAKYALSKADLRKLESPTGEIAAGALPVNIGEVDLDGVTPVAGGLAGITNAFGIRTTGNILLADRLTFTSAAAASPRVLTLGGAAGGADLDKTTPTASAVEVLAIPGLDNSTTGTGGQINATGSTVQLRAAYIALGETPSPLAGRPFIDALLPTGGTPLTTAATKTQYVDNATSTLYVAIPPYAKQTPAPQALVTAGTLVIAAGQWALIQNTAPTTTPGGGIIATTLKFNKVAGAAAADPEIAVFGSIGGKTGVASAISIDSASLDGISPNSIRVNGCVALSTAGCIQSAVSIPLINLADPGQSLLISNSPDLALSVELITGATNEALWREDDDAPGQNRPQRESRP